MGDEHQPSTKEPETFWKAAHKALYYLSGEWMLKRHVNGGTVIFFRSCQVALTAYVVALLLRHGALAKIPPDWEPVQLLRDFGETLPWLAAIFAGVYVALYTRFAAQFSYLANVYNLMMSTQAQIPDPDKNPKIRRWKAGLIEDAEDLHLATKPMFAMTIWHLLLQPEIVEEFEATVDKGPERLRNLQMLLGSTLGLEVPEKKPDAATGES